MEEVMDFDKWIEEQQSKEIKYFAIFDNVTGQIRGVYPDYACEGIVNKVLIDNELAVGIIEGKINPSSARVNLSSGNFEIIELINLNRLDFLLHRIPDIRYIDQRENEIFITYHRKTGELKFEMADKFYGTKKTKNDILKRKAHWSGDTELVFLLTDYNDPNIIRKTFSFKIDNLIENSHIENVGQLPEKFSIFTRRLFMNYILEIDENI
jgi:hypothetical protein